MQAIGDRPRYGRATHRHKFVRTGVVWLVVWIGIGAISGAATVLAVCGDGVVDAGDECDNGGIWETSGTMVRMVRIHSMHGRFVPTVPSSLCPHPLVNITLGNAEPSACGSGVPPGAEVNITLIVQAVNNALNGCLG